MIMSILISHLSLYPLIMSPSHLQLHVFLVLEIVFGGGVSYFVLF